jgi:hypothetical protein
MTKTQNDPVAPVAQPLRSALELSASLSISAFESFKSFSGVTSAVAQAAQDHCQPVALMLAESSYYQPVVSKLNDQIFNVDAKLNQYLPKITETAAEIKDKRLAPLLERAQTQRARISTYGSEVVTNANTAAHKAVENNLHRTRQALQNLLATLQKYESELEAQIPYSAELRARISALILAAGELSLQGRELVATRRLRFASALRDRAQPVRQQLEQRLEFVATEIEKRLVRGENQQVEVGSLVARVQALLLAASDAIGKATVTAVRGTAKFVGPARAAFVAEQEEAAVAEEEEAAQPGEPVVVGDVEQGTRKEATEEAKHEIGEGAGEDVKEEGDEESGQEEDDDSHLVTNTDSPAASANVKRRHRNKLNRRRNDRYSYKS